MGSTAIEDKLQNDVSTTIQLLREARLKLWILTGDKIETAINVGYSSGVIDNNFFQSQISNADLVVEQLGNASKNKIFADSKKKDHALIFNGECLN